MAVPSKSLIKVSHSLEGAVVLTNLLDTLVELLFYTEKYVKQIMDGSPTTAQSASATIRSNIISGVSNALVNTTPSILFREFDSLNQALKEIDSDFANEDLLKSLKMSLGRFHAALDSYISSRGSDYAVDLVFLAKDLRTIKQNIKDICALVSASGNRHLDFVEDFSDMEIYFPSVFDLREVAEKLSALSDIYDKLANLLSISTEDYPLLVKKVESGSLLAILTGHKEIIAFLINVVKNGASYVYRNRSREGQLKAIDEKFDTVDKYLHVIGRLKELGIETKDNEEEAKIATLQIGKSFNILLGNQNCIELNGEVLQTPPTDRMMRLRREPTLLPFEPKSGPEEPPRLN